MSRDGSLVYLAGGGRLRVFSPALGRGLAGYPAEGDDIVLVAGG